MFKIRFNKKAKKKKTAWELIDEIPKTPEQKKIDREISKIEKKNQDKIKKKPNKKVKNQLKTKDTKKYKSVKIKKNKNSMKKKSVINYNKDYYGNNAGKIWNALNKYGPLSRSSVIQKTKLSIKDFYISVGWLARENKIYKDIRFYKLGDTNLTSEIGENAGKIWRFLDSQGQTNVSSIIKSADMKIHDVYSAIGWLSRENKLKTKCKNRFTLYELT
jgi:hypothetical protein